MNSAVKYGLITGVISIVLATILYAVGTEVFIDIGGWTGLVGIALYVYFGIQMRKENGGYFTFGEAFKSLFSMMLVASFVGVAYRWLLFNVIDSDLGPNVKTIMMDRLEAEYEKAGLDGAQIDAALGMMDQWEFGMNMNGLNTGIMIFASLVGSAVLAAVIGAIIKKKAPMDLGY